MDQRPSISAAIENWRDRCRINFRFFVCRFFNKVCYNIKRQEAGILSDEWKKGRRFLLRLKIDEIGVELIFGYE